MPAGSGSVIPPLWLGSGSDRLLYKVYAIQKDHLLNWDSIRD